MTMLSYEDQLFLLVKTIAERRTITPASKPVVIEPSQHFTDQINGNDLASMLEKLQDDEKIIKVVQRPDKKRPKKPGSPWTTYKIMVLPRFDEYFNSISTTKAPKLEKTLSVEIPFDSKYNIVLPPGMRLSGSLSNQQFQRHNLQDVKVSSDETVCRIEYDKMRRLKINGEHKLTLHLNRPNEIIFRHLFDNPNEPWVIEDIKHPTGKVLKKSIQRVRYELGFTGPFGHLVFNASGDAAIFKNPITKREMEQHGLTKEDMLNMKICKKKSKT